jgi:hypothetical protein
VKYIGSHVPRMEGGILDIHADAPHMSSLDLWLTREGVCSSEDGDQACTRLGSPSKIPLSDSIIEDEQSKSHAQVHRF